MNYGDCSTFGYGWGFHCPGCGSLFEGYVKRIDAAQGFDNHREHCPILSPGGTDKDQPDSETETGKTGPYTQVRNWSVGTAPDNWHGRRGRGNIRYQNHTLPLPDDER